MKGDPYWLNARFSSTCTGCSARIKKGDRIFYYPRTGETYCQKEACGGAASADFRAHVEDEASCCW